MNTKGATTRPTSDKIVACRVASNYPFAKLMEIAESVPTERTRATSDKILNFYNFMRALLRQFCHLSLACRVKLSFRKINGNRRKCAQRTRACDKRQKRQATKFLIFIISSVRCSDKLSWAMLKFFQYI